MEWVQIILTVLGLLACLAAGFGIGIAYRKKVAEREIGSAETEATRLINEAIRSGENRKKEMLLEAKDEIHKSRTEYEKEVKERRAELSKQERRLEQKEATLDKKTEAFERKEEELAKKLQKVAETQAQAAFPPVWAGDWLWAALSWAAGVWAVLSSVLPSFP